MVTYRKGDRGGALVPARWQRDIDVTGIDVVAETGQHGGNDLGGELAIVLGVGRNEGQAPDAGAAEPMQGRERAEGLVDAYALAGVEPLRRLDRPPRGGPSSKLVQGRPLLHGSLGRRSRPGERSRPSGEGRHEHLRGRWSVAERGVRAHAVVV